MRKPSKKTLKRQADKLFAILIKLNRECEWCGRRPPEIQLQCAHTFSRRYLVTRWELLNGTALCAGCHRRAHDQPIEFAEFQKELLGEGVYDELRRIAKTSIKKIDLHEKIEELKKMIEMKEKGLLEGLAYKD